MHYKELISILQKLINRPVSQKELMNILGIKAPTTMSGRANRNSKFTLDEIRKIETAFNIDILNMRNDDFIDIPVRGEVYASMGSGITVYNEEKTGTYKISRELARDIGINISNSEMIMASGDSMVPTIEGGDTLLIDRNKKEIFDGKIYCIRIDGKLFVKRLQYIPPQIVKVVSDNKDKYDAFYIDFSKNADIDFQVIGEVRWWGRIAK